MMAHPQGPYGQQQHHGAYGCTPSSPSASYSIQQSGPQGTVQLVPHQHGASPQTVMQQQQPQQSSYGWVPAAVQPVAGHVMATAPQHYTHHHQYAPPPSFVHCQLTPSPPQHPTPDAVLEVYYLPPSCCCSCCACCGTEQQPDSRPDLEIAIKGKDLGRVRQGQTSSFFLTPGVSTQIIAKNTGVVGFVNSLFGSTTSGCAGSVAVCPTPGEVIMVELLWKPTGCCSSKYNPHLRRVTVAPRM